MSDRKRHTAQELREAANAVVVEPEYDGNRNPVYTDIYCSGKTFKASVVESMLLQAADDAEERTRVEETLGTVAAGEFPGLKSFGDEVRAARAVESIIIGHEDAGSDDAAYYDDDYNRAIDRLEAAHEVEVAALNVRLEAVVKKLEDMRNYCVFDCVDREDVDAILRAARGE